MPYCPDCGVRSENGAPACSSCGLVFSPEPESKEPESEMSDNRQSAGHSDSNNRSASMPQTSSIEEHTSYVMRDTQLGKGTIKPFSVELGVDGYHFKFEEPPRRLSKPEPSKEKNAEFRVTEADKNRFAQTFPAFSDKTDDAVSGSAQSKLVDETELEPFVPQNEPVEDVEPSSLETGISEQSVDLEASPNETEREVSPEPGILRADLPENPELQPDEQVPVDEKTNALQPDIENLPIETKTENSTELLPENKPEEAALAIVWKGNRSFLGVPFSEQYQVTNRSLIVDMPKSGRHIEYSLTAVVTVSVKQTWLDKVLGIGDLTFKVRAGSDTVQVVLKGIANPMNVLGKVADLIGSGYNRKHE